MSTEDNDDGPAMAQRGPELVTALILCGLGLLVITDSLRVGIGWADDGPRSGYFPFYIGMLLLASSGWTVVTTLLRWRSDTGTFAAHSQLALVIAVAVPMVVHVVLIYFIGLYVASALLIAWFMVRHGRYRWPATLAVSVGVPVACFAVFERWFLVPLPKGPLEQLIGL